MSINCIQYDNTGNMILSDDEKIYLVVENVQLEYDSGGYNILIINI